MRQLYQGPDGQLYEVIKEDPHFQVRTLAAQGGGLMFVVSDREFISKFKPAEFAPWRRAKVCIDYTDQVFDCWLRDEKWNGWDCPAFTFDQAESLQKFFTDITYDEVRDEFWLPGHYEDEASERYPATQVLVNGTIMTVYPIGAKAWIWSEVEEEIEHVA